MMMFLIQGDQNFCIGCPDGSGGAVSIVDRAVRQAEIIQNGDQFVLRNLFPNGLLYLIAQPGSFLDSQAGASAHVHAEQAGIHFRKKVLAHKKDKPYREHAETQKRADDHPPMLQAPFQRLNIAGAKPVEPRLESTGKAAEEASFAFRVLLSMVMHVIL